MAACHCYSWSDNFWVRLIGSWMASLLCYLQSVIVEFSLQQVQGFMVCNQFIKWTWCLLQFATEFSRQEMVTLKKVITPATIRVPRTQTALQQLESLHKVHLISGSNFLVTMKTRFVGVLSSFPALPEMLCTIGFPNSGFQFGTVLHPEPTISQVVGMVCSLSWFTISFFC